MNGKKLVVWHDREFVREPDDVTHTARHGRTIAVIWDGGFRHVGIAECSACDQFNRKKGRMIACRRAEFQLAATATSLCRILHHPLHFSEALERSHDGRLAGIPKWMWLPDARFKENGNGGQRPMNDRIIVRPSVQDEATRRKLEDWLHGGPEGIAAFKAWAGQKPIRWEIGGVLYVLPGKYGWMWKERTP